MIEDILKRFDEEFYTESMYNGIVSRDGKRDCLGLSDIKTFIKQALEAERREVAREIFDELRDIHGMEWDGETYSCDKRDYDYLKKQYLGDKQ